MAEAVLGGLAKAVLAQIASPAIKESKLLWGHEKELKKLEDTIATIKNVLEDAERRRPTDTAVQGWLARLKDVLYDADDLFDHVSYMVLHEKTKTGSKITKEIRCLLSKPYHLFRHSQKAKAIRESLDDIAGDINKFGLLTSWAQTDQEQPNGVQREQTHSYIRISEVVGRDQEREDIIKLLLADNCRDERGVSVVAVIGIGGMGKTTLGQFIYNDERVNQGFDLCIWCCVNYFSNLKVALEAIIKSATGSAAPERLDVDQLQSLLRETIEGRRFLLVLDDVWDEDALNWRKLQILLDSGKGQSVVLVTTRSVEVAQSMGAAKPYYRLQHLSDGSAWLLFKKIAFGKESEDQKCQDMEQLGRRIVNKCGNAPLAIVIIAGLLKHKKKNKWFRFVDEELSKVVPVGHGKMMQVLKMSYNTLPSPVKRCFAYCSLFPKDEYLDKDMLVHLWIAQGFVEDCAAGQSLEYVAEDYLLCLVNRCFLQKSEEEYRTSFRMHDLVHDLASEVAGSESVLVDKIGPNFGDNTLRHVSLSNAASVEQLSSVSQSKRLRTFLLEESFSSRKIRNVDRLISCFKAIRVLDLSEMDIEKIPDSMGQLIHLRYLDLSQNDMEMLPSSICSLHHLQYLILHGCSCLKELPKEIGKLIRLRHLEIRRCFSLSQMPAGLANLTSLVALDHLIVHSSSGGLRYLGFLDNLSGLLQIELPEAVWKNAEVDAHKACLSRKHRLQELRIDWKSKVLEGADAVMNALQPHGNLESLEVSGFGGGIMPCWISEIHNLMSLTIEDCGRCVELPSLRHLQFLKVLEIKRMSSMVVIEGDGKGSMSDNPDSIFFPSLETLSMCEMPNLTGWWNQSPSIQPAFRYVTKVSISDCPKLTTSMPLFPQVENLSLCDIQEKLFWHAIKCDETCRLNTLYLSRIHGLRILPGAQIRHLSALRSLMIRHLRELAISFVSGLAYLNCLERLEISQCEKLEWIDVDGDTKRSEISGSQLARLRILEIPVVDRNVLCKQLKYMTSLERLTLNTFDKELLHLKEGVEEEVWKSLQKLHRIALGNCFDADIAHHLPMGVVYLNSLREVSIYGCKELYLSWRVILSLHHLHILIIEVVDKVIDVDSVMVHGQHNPLQQLRICSSTGEWMQDIPWRSFSSLRSLYLRSIYNMEALPEGIQHLTALQNLDIFLCKSVASLPHWMTHLSSLRSLKVADCAEELKVRCKRTTGEDWLNIQHVPDITIDFIKI